MKDNRFDRSIYRYRSLAPIDIKCGCATYIASRLMASGKMATVFLNVRTTLECATVWSGTGFIKDIRAAGRGPEAPGLSFSGLCGVIDESKLVAIRLTYIGAIESVTVLRSIARNVFICAAKLQGESMGLLYLFYRRGI